MNFETIRVDIPLNKIKLPDGDFNVREEVTDKEVESLALSIKEQGLLNPLIVEAVEGSDTYVLTSGFRRHKALLSLKIKGTVPVTVRKFDSAADATLVNLVENVERKDVRTADLAKRLYEMDAGEYPGASTIKDPVEGIDVYEGVGIDRKVICARTGLSKSYVGNLIRCWGALCDEVKAGWRKLDIPSDEVIAWAKLDTEEEQIAAFEAWKAAAEAKKVKKAKRAAGEATDEDGEGAAPKGPRKRKEISTMLAKFREKLESGPALKGVELEVANAKIDTLRWALGEIKRLTLGG